MEFKFKKRQLEYLQQHIGMFINQLHTGMPTEDFWDGDWDDFSGESFLYPKRFCILKGDIQSKHNILYRPLREVIKQYFKS